MKLTVSILGAFIFLSNIVCFGAPVVLPGNKLEKLEFIIKTFKMPPRNIWIYLFVVAALIVVMLIDLKKHNKQRDTQ